MTDKKVAVLGRGGSLKKFRKYSYLFDTLYVVGTLHKEINKLRFEHFKGKEIIHIAGRSDWGWRDDLDKKLNITRVQIMYYPHQLKKKKGKKSFKERFKDLNISFLPDYMKDRGYPLVSRKKIEKYSKRYDNYKDMCDFLEKEYPDEIKDGIELNNRSRWWPTSGIFAVDLCLVENLPEKIYIFGIDCYETLSYIRYKSWEPSGLRGDNTEARLMVYHLSELSKEFHDTEFYSSAPIKIESKNWHSI